MENLVKLLNEYELKQVENAEGLDVSKVWIMNGTLHYYDNYKDELVFDNIDLLIISSRYGFIERLVNNDKIEHIRMYQILETPTTYYDTYESMLMRLSIQDNPIEYLCSILKE